MKFTINEKALAEGLLPGTVMLERVRQLREKLIEGQDFLSSKIGVMYSKTGIKKMAELLKVDTPEKSEVTENRSQITDYTETLNFLKALSTPPEKKRVSKLRPFKGNKKYLSAEEVQTGFCLTVHVRDNTHFTLDMIIEVVKGHVGVWDYLGPMPRERGRM